MRQPPRLVIYSQSYTYIQPHQSYYLYMYIVYTFDAAFQLNLKYITTWLLNVLINMVNGIATNVININAKYKYIYKQKIKSSKKYLICEANLIQWKNQYFSRDMIVIDWKFAMA